MTMRDEFKAFVSRGNVVDLAVGVIIGGAFGKIVSSLVSDILMPVLGIVLGKINLTGLKATIGTELTGSVTISYGNFLQNTIDFLIVAFALFLVIKGINHFRRKEEAQPPAAPAPTKEEALLAEIRDILKSQNRLAA